MSLKAIAAIFGYSIDKDEDFKEDDFKKHVDEKYILKENAHEDDEVKSKITGKVTGALTTKVAQLFNIPKSELKDKKWEDVLDLGKSKVDTQLKEANEKAGKGADERVIKLEKDLENERTLKTDLEITLNKTKEEYEAQIAVEKNNLKAIKLGTKVNEVKSKIQFVDDFNNDAMKKAGFNAIIAEKYNVNLDDKDELVVTGKDLKPVKHPTKSGHNANFEDVLTMEAEAFKVLKKNNTKPEDFGKRNLVVGGEGKEVDFKKVHPNAIKNLEKLNS